MHPPGSGRSSKRNEECLGELIAKIVKVANGCTVVGAELGLEGGVTVEPRTE